MAIYLITLLKTVSGDSREIGRPEFHSGSNGALPLGKVRQQADLHSGRWLTGWLSTVEKLDSREVGDQNWSGQTVSMREGVKEKMELNDAGRSARGYPTEKAYIVNPMHLEREREREKGLRVRRRHENFREARIPAANCALQFWASLPGCDHLRRPQIHQEQPGPAFEGTAPGPRRLPQIRPPTPLNKPISSDPTFDFDRQFTSDAVEIQWDPSSRVISGKTAK
ncbi:uncharacterized protein LOC125314654 [Rhodamnia argentea]|uniref:Uncharacterized protein LOC125314654 n=1 Tax=Rhodamnia argentea TaxID=178133 RepID=A0ABM3HA22_9MYRT|nr:uncharacterized protein LOC125314654 [Rhodamnia argentea]